MPGKDIYIQSLRGLSICGVVLIHTLPHADWAVWIRPFINCSVAMFVFLSGYFTPRGKVTCIKEFYGRRIGKVAIPFCIWSLAYLLYDRKTTITEAFYAFVTGTSAAQMYYLLVYLQLVLLTPIIWHVWDKRYIKIFLWCISPLALLLKYLFSIKGIELPLQTFCIYWIIYYIAGMKFSDNVFKSGYLNKNKSILWTALIISFIVQEACGQFWLYNNQYDLAISQLKFSSMVTSLVSVIVFTIGVSPSFRNWLSSCNTIVKLGNASFGIYLNHMAMRVIVNRFILISNSPIIIVIKFILTISLSLFLVQAARYIFSKRILKWIGFE